MTDEGAVVTHTHTGEVETHHHGPTTHHHTYDIDHDTDHVHHHTHHTQHTHHGKEDKQMENIIAAMAGQKGTDPALAALLAKDNRNGMDSMWPLLLLLLLGRGRGGLLGGDEAVATNRGAETRIELNEDIRGVENDIAGVQRDVLQGQAGIREEIAKAGWKVDSDAAERLQVLTSMLSGEFRNTDRQFCETNTNIQRTQAELTDLLYQQTVAQNNQFAESNLANERRANEIKQELCATNNRMEHNTSQIRFDIERGNAATQLEIERKANQTNLLIEREACATRAEVAREGSATRALIHKEVEERLRNENLALRDKLNEEKERAREDREVARQEIIVGNTNANINNTNSVATATFQNGVLNTLGSLASALQTIHATVANINTGTQTLANSLNPTSTVVRA